MGWALHCRLNTTVLLCGLALVWVAPAAVYSACPNATTSQIMIHWTDDIVIMDDKILTNSSFFCFRVAVDVNDEFVILALNDTAPNFEVKVGNTTLGILDETQDTVAVVKPSLWDYPCEMADSSTCFVYVFVTSESEEPIPISMIAVKGHMLQFAERRGGILRRGDSRRYGIEVDESHTPILFALVPDRNLRDMDLDMFLYHESFPLSYFFPNVRDRNSHGNEDELVLLQRESTFFRPGLYIMEVAAPPETIYDVNTYDVIIHANWDESNVFGVTLLAIIMISGILFMLCICVTGVVRRRQMASQEGVVVGPTPRGATQEELDHISEVHYEEGLSLASDEGQCTVCLCDYEEGDALRRLKCHHYFHKECLDTWLKHNKVCPLCQQDIATATDMHGDKKNKALTPSASSNASGKLKTSIIENVGNSFSNQDASNNLSNVIRYSRSLNNITDQQRNREQSVPLVLIRSNSHSRNDAASPAEIEMAENSTNSTPST